MTSPIVCQHAACNTPATTGGIVTVQPNGLAPTHATYYACGDHPDILTDALETWPVRTGQAAGDAA